MANQYRRDKRTRASHGCNAQPSSLRNPQEWSTEALGRKRARIGKTRLAAHDFRQQAPGGRAEREPMVPVARFVAYRTIFRDLAEKHVGKHRRAFDDPRMAEARFLAGALMPVDQNDVATAPLQMQGRR